MTDAFVAEVTRSIRRSLFHRIKGYGFSQDELTRIVSGATKETVRRAYVADLAGLAAAADSLAQALGAAAPGDPAGEDWNTVKANLPPAMAVLFEP